MKKRLTELTQEGSAYWDKNHINHQKSVDEVLKLREMLKMANEKFEPQGELSEVEIRLECLRLATEFGPEYERKDPLPKAQEYFDWATKKNSKRQSEKTAKKKV